MNTKFEVWGIRKSGGCKNFIGSGKDFTLGSTKLSVVYTVVVQKAWLIEL